MSDIENPPLDTATETSAAKSVAGNVQNPPLGGEAGPVGKSAVIMNPELEAAGSSPRVAPTGGPPSIENPVLTAPSSVPSSAKTYVDNPEPAAKAASAGDAKKAEAKPKAKTTRRRTTKKTR